MKKFFVPNSFVEIIICGISGLPSEIKEEKWILRKIEFIFYLIGIDIILSSIYYVVNKAQAF